VRDSRQLSLFPRWFAKQQALSHGTRRLATIETSFLSGDAYNLVGNREQAKTNYLTVLRSGNIPKLKSVFCYNILLTFYCIPLTSPRRPINEIDTNIDSRKMDVALLTCRLCMIYAVFAIVCLEILSFFLSLPLSLSLSLSAVNGRTKYQARFRAHWLLLGEGSDIPDSGSSILSQEEHEVSTTG